jgi:hypothetical protein
VNKSQQTAIEHRIAAIRRVVRVMPHVTDKRLGMIVDIAVELTEHADRLRLAAEIALEDVQSEHGGRR